MDKLEQYLELACRGIGGPRAMRQHLREELRQHLNDAIEDHVVQGMPRDAAIARALEDFGGADQLRSELEATHGHRLMAVLIDKALDWKEHTMKAKWLWSTWAHVTLLLTIAVELIAIICTTVLVLPKFEEIMHDIWDSPRLEAPEWDSIRLRAHGVFEVLRDLGNATPWILLGLLVAWALFEWRVRSENKSFMRLSAMGLIAIMLGVLSTALFAAMIIPTSIAVPIMQTERPEAVVAYQNQRLNDAISAVETSAAEHDWMRVGDPMSSAGRAMDTLNAFGGTGPSIVASHHKEELNATRDELRSAGEALAKRDCPGGIIFHVLNRAVARIQLFKHDRDYEAWERTLVEALNRLPIDLLAYCIMPNHWHLVLRPKADGNLSAFMQWFTLAHAQRWRVAHQTVGFGPLYQGRFKAFPIECDEHLLTVLRYVERNALRAKLVKDVQSWRWGSYHARTVANSVLHPMLCEWPIDMPKNWRRLLNTPQTAAEEEAVQLSIRRGRPFGDPDWREQIAKQLSLGRTLRTPGRPHGS